MAEEELVDLLPKMLIQRSLHFWEDGLEDGMLRILAGQHFFCLTMYKAMC